MALIIGMPSIDIFLVAESKPPKVFKTSEERQKAQLPSFTDHFSFTDHISLHSDKLTWPDS